MCAFYTLYDARVFTAIAPGRYTHYTRVRSIRRAEDAETRACDFRKIYAYVRGINGFIRTDGRRGACRPYRACFVNIQRSIKFGFYFFYTVIVCYGEFAAVLYARNYEYNGHANEKKQRKQTRMR